MKKFNEFANEAVISDDYISGESNMIARILQDIKRLKRYDITDEQPNGEYIEVSTVGDYIKYDDIEDKIITKYEDLLRKKLK